MEEAVEVAGVVELEDVGSVGEVPGGGVGGVLDQRKGGVGREETGSGFA